MKQKVIDYINSIPLNSRDQVLETILKDDIIGRVLETPEGKALFSGIIEGINKRIMALVEACTANSTIDPDIIKDVARSVGQSFRLLKDWAVIFEEAKKHKGDL